MPEVFPTYRVGVLLGAGGPDFLGFWFWLMDFHSDLEYWILQELPGPWIDLLGTH